MLWMFLIAGMTGILCGNLYRAPALIAISFASVAWVSIVLLLTDYPLGSALIIAFLVTGVMQMGYLLGAGCGNLGRHVRPRASTYMSGGGWRMSGVHQRSRRSLIPNG